MKQMRTVTMPGCSKLQVDFEDDMGIYTEEYE